MDTQKLADAVQREVALKIVQNKMFTCYDITKALREGTDERVDHQEVRAVIYDLERVDSMFTDYTRYTCTTRNGELVEVFVNFNDYGHDDAQSYITGVSTKRKATPGCTDCKESLRELEHELANAMNFLYDINKTFGPSAITILDDLSDAVASNC